MYTKERYDTVLSNIDSLHFLIQSAISLTNLRILLAFREDFNPIDTTTFKEEKDANSKFATTRGTAVDNGRPGAAVEAIAGIILLSTGILMALDDRLIDLSSIDFKAASETSIQFISSMTRTIQSWRDYAQEFDSSFTSLLNVQTHPANALSVPTWGVHVFSLVEWLVAMGFVGLWHANPTQRVENVNVGDVTITREWNMRSHATFFQQRSELRMVSHDARRVYNGWEYQFALRFKTLANEEPRLDVFLAEEDDKEEKKKKINTEAWRQKTRIEIWDVERLGLLFEKDDEFTFSFKIALVSIGIGRVASRARKLGVCA